MSFTHPQSRQLPTAIFMQGVQFALFQQSQKLVENLNLTPAFGLIEARQFFKIQAQTRLYPKSPSPIDNSDTEYEKLH